MTTTDPDQTLRTTLLDGFDPHTPISNAVFGEYDIATLHDLCTGWPAEDTAPPAEPGEANPDTTPDEAPDDPDSPQEEPVRTPDTDPEVEPEPESEPAP